MKTLLLNIILLPTILSQVTRNTNKEDQTECYNCLKDENKAMCKLGGYVG